ncbi:hypothetical protein [Natronorubrum tibetense]|uniref:hypothetical protein n=1 Tax=Natronorubrum tibetense TaxID=63128 RepID=UPI0012683DB8|nr:hypothetical protein [Natronorubrum tibetense]
MDGIRSTKQSRPVLSRRGLLGGVSVITCTTVAGCTYFPSEIGASEDEIEVLVDNASGQPVEVAVLLTDDEDEHLFSHVFSLDTDQFGRAGDITQEPLEVNIFTSNGHSKSWEYTPNHPRGSDCDMGDIGMTLNQDGTVDQWYDC